MKVPVFLFLGLPITARCISVHSEQALQARGKNLGTPFFLFLANDSIPTEDIWTSFFHQGNGTDFYVFVHCQHKKMCENNIKNRSLYRIIDTVDSTYCKDLVSPMKALFRAAVNHPVQHHQFDKFIMLSDNSVPIKPFDYALDVLVSGTSSIITNGAKGASPYCGIKTSQWVVLNRPHAHTYLQDPWHLHYWPWPECSLMCHSYNYILNWDTACATLHGCLDEFYTLTSILGQLPGNPLDVKTQLILHDIAVGRTMFHDWSLGYSTTNNATMTDVETVPMLLQDSPVLLQEKAEIEGPMGPAAFNSFTREDLTKFRESSWLFLRKVEKAKFVDPHAAESMTLPAAFMKYVLEV